MAVPALQILVGLILVLLGIGLAAKPLTTKRDQWVCRSLFIFLGVLLGALSWIQYRNVQNMEAFLREKLLTANTPPPTVAEQLPQRETGVSETNHLELQQYHDLLEELAGNTSLAPDVREKIIIATAKLRHEDRIAHPAPSSSAIIAAQMTREKALPMFDYAIHQLEAISEKQAAMEGDKTLINYQGFPVDLSPDAKNGKQSRRSIAEVRLRGNAAFDFQVYFAESVLPKYEASMGVIGKGGVLVLRNEGDGLETKLQCFSGESFDNNTATSSQAKTNISQALDRLMTAELAALDVKN